MRRRSIWILLITALIAAALGAALYVRARSAPEPARLLPEGDAIVYINFKPIRAAAGLGKNPVSPDQEYAEFIQETGFQFERDLDEVAVVAHPAETGGVEGERRFSEVFVGRFDGARLKHYLHKLAADVEMYRDTEIFVIPHEGRTVRAAILSVDSVAVSNTADSKNIRFMVDRYHKGALPFGGAWMLRSNYRKVPFGSLAWAIMRFPSPDGKGTTLPLPGGVNFTLPSDALTVASVRYTGSVQIKVEAFTTSAKSAEKLNESAETFLALFRAIETSVETKGPDPDVKAFFESLRLEHDDKRVTLTAEVPVTFVKKLVSDVPVNQSPATDQEPVVKEKGRGKDKTKATH
jgi:hypothetical protein